jgi:hypothetical protein
LALHHATVQPDPGKASDGDADADGPVREAR